MILTRDDFQIREEDTETVPSKISNQLHLQGFENKDYKGNPKIIQ